MVSLTTKGYDAKEIIRRTAQFTIGLSIAVGMGEKYKAADMLEVLGGQGDKKKMFGILDPSLSTVAVQMLRITTTTKNTILRH